MSGEFFAILTTLCWSIGIFPFTAATRRLGALPVNQYRLLFAFLIVSALLLFGYKLSLAELFSSPQQKQYIYLCLSGIIGYTFGDFFGFTSFARLGPKLASVYTTLAPGFALFFGFFILGEEINLLGIAGIMITIFGVIWLTRSKKDAQEANSHGFGRDKTGILFGVLSALCQGLGLTLSKFSLNLNTAEQHIPELHANWIRLMGGFSSALLFSIVTRRFREFTLPVFKNKNNGLPFMLMGAIFGPVMGVTFSLIAVKKMNVAAAQTIFALLPVFVLPINYFVYKEKITLSAILACLMAIAGVMVLIWRETLLALFTG